MKSTTTKLVTIATALLDTYATNYQVRSAMAKAKKMLESSTSVSKPSLIEAYKVVLARKGLTL